MKIELHIQKDRQAVARQAFQALNDAAQEAQEAQGRTVQLAWDLGDILQTAREESPQTYEAFREGAGIPVEVASKVLRVRRLSETRDGVPMRQALFELLVPAKEGGEERIELAPPQTWRKWVNASRVWLQKVEVGLDGYELKAFVQETENLWKTLSEARRRAGL